jgi:hypothetical protein
MLEDASEISLANKMSDNFKNLGDQLTAVEDSLLLSDTELGMINLEDFLGLMPEGVPRDESHTAWLEALARSRSASPQRQQERRRETAEEASTAAPFLTCTQTHWREVGRNMEHPTGSSMERPTAPVEDAWEAAARSAAACASEHARKNAGKRSASKPAAKLQHGANQQAKRVQNKRRGSEAQKGYFPGPRALRSLRKASVLPHDVDSVEDYAPAALVNGLWSEATFLVLWQNGERTWEPASFFAMEIGIDAMLDWVDIIVERARRSMGLQRTASGAVLGHSRGD